MSTAADGRVTPYPSSMNGGATTSGTITLRGATDDEVARIRRACGRDVHSWHDVIDWYRETETELALRKLQAAELERKKIENERRLNEARERIAREDAAEREAETRALAEAFGLRPEDL
jgi:hypothetical protein